MRLGCSANDVLILSLGSKMTSNFSVRTSKAGWRPSKSFWITAAIWLLFLIIAIVPGGFAVWLVMFALFLILTALYALICGRRSWLGLPHRKGAGGAVGAGVAALIVGAMLTGTSGPAPGETASLAGTQTAAPSAATPSAAPSANHSATPTANATDRIVLLAGCLEDGESATQLTETVVCTLDDKGVLVWMSEKESTTVLNARTETKRAAELQAAAEKTVADEAARVAAEQAIADEAARAAAQQADADAAWAAAQQTEAERVAAEQAAQQQAPPIQGLVEVPADVYYQNCTAARAAGAAPLHVGEPGYRLKMDGDGDGIACE